MHQDLSLSFEMTDFLLGCLLDEQSKVSLRLQNKKTLRHFDQREKSGCVSRSLTVVRDDSFFIGLRIS